MADKKDLKKFKNGIRLDPSSAPANPDKGTTYVDTSGNLQVHDGSDFINVSSNPVITIPNQTVLDAYTPAEGDIIVCTGAGQDFTAKTLKNVTVIGAAYGVTLELGNCTYSVIRSEADIKFHGVGGQNLINLDVMAYTTVTFLDCDLIHQCKIIAQDVYFGNVDSPYDLHASTAEIKFQQSQLFCKLLKIYPDNPNTKKIVFKQAKVDVTGTTILQVAGVLILDECSYLRTGYFQGVTGSQVWCHDSSHLQSFGLDDSTSLTYMNIYNFDGSSAKNTDQRQIDEEFSVRKGTFNDTSVWE